jgi:hypothetical protein
MLRKGKSLAESILHILRLFVAVIFVQNEACRSKMIDSNPKESKDNLMAFHPHQHIDETKPGYQPVRTVERSMAAKAKGVRLKRLRKEERQARIPSWQAYYSKGGEGWRQAFEGALEIFYKEGEDEDALEEAAEWAGWDYDYLRREFREIHVMVRDSAD